MRYYLATNEIDIFHFGEIEDESILTTGQPKVFYFNTEQELIDKLTQLTGNKDYYKNNIPKISFLPPSEI